MLSRREFVTAVTLPLAAGMSSNPGVASLRSRAPGPRSPDLRVDAAALRRRIEELSVFGRPAGGSFADGVSRVSYTDADIEGRAYVMRLMRAAGLEPTIDPAGNIFGRHNGTEAGLPPILFGSHIDSVPSGGNFDGDLGTLAALGVIEACAAASVRTRHPLEMVIWAHEEGVAFNRGLAGSRIVAGDIQPADLDQVWNGLRRADAIRKIGGNPDRIMDARRARGSHHCYLELHIEQGGTLDRSGTPIGVVQGIVCIERHEAAITGFANHAGTTPMDQRQDAMIAAAQLTLAVREIVTASPGRQVGTVGQIEISPNAPNVVPGTAKLVIELRDLSPEKLENLGARIRTRAADIGASTRTQIEIRRVSRNLPADASPEVQSAIERASSSLALASTRLPSGAGHDAQSMAQLGPMGMIFVPSIGGVSHSPKELTRWEDCANGADVLLQTILTLDRV
jgi:N-carbamoyl-L-amino-acid hydrolase